MILKQSLKISSVLSLRIYILTLKNFGDTKKFIINENLQTNSITDYTSLVEVSLFTLNQLALSKYACIIKVSLKKFKT